MTAISAAKNLATVFKAASNGGATLGKAAEVMNLKLLLIVAAIGIVVTACVWMYRNWDKVTAWAQRMGTKVSEVWASIQTAVLTTVAALVRDSKPTSRCSPPTFPAGGAAYPQPPKM